MRIMKCTARGGKEFYGIVDGTRVRPLRGCQSVEELFGALRKRRPPAGPPIALSSVKMLPPTDPNARIFCAGLNYRDHADELRMPAPKSPIFFTKTSGALSGANDDIVYPEGVKLLDHELELALVIGRRIGKDERVTAENLSEFSLGIAIFNDVSARDVQLSTGQWFLGKTYRTFAPTGPVVQTLDAAALERLYALDMELKVYDPDGKLHAHKHQAGTTANMIFRLHELVACLAQRFDLLPGDVIATGTPKGVALGKPARLQVRMAEILGIPQGKRTARFIAGEIAHNDRYLRPGDVIEARIASPDGVVDLGVQRTRIR
ncbi:MAG: FAA hydrolase family protein [Spirochaetes bacterium]|nr:MAG: FAA hydrolase family protein [Spirochaetota bacterium]